VLPDGRIVYSTDRTKNRVWELWVIDPATGNQEKLTIYNDKQESIDAFDPMVMPDGQIIYSAYNSSRTNYKLWTIDLSCLLTP